MVVISGQSITLANSIIGVGILAMPFCFKECGIILAVIILLISGIISRLACHFLLKSAMLCRRRNFESLAFQVFGPSGKFGVEIGIIGFLLGTCIAYFVVVGDLGPQIIVKMFDLNNSDSLRTFVMICVSIVCVLPLGLLRNVDSLNNVCAATILFYLCLAFKVMVEATSPMIKGDWISHVEYWRTDGVLQCMPIFSMALFCQTQLFQIYEMLPGASLDKMNHITKSAINVCTVVYILVGFFGYIAFYTKPISGNILMNFSPTLTSDAIKIGFVMSLAFSFPLIIFPCRASLYSLLYRKGQSMHHEVISNLIPEGRFKGITISIIAISLITGLLIPNIELVLGLVGSTIGVMICVIFPAACIICLSNKNTKDRLLAQVILFAGVIIMVLGTYANLQAVDNHVNVEKYATPKTIKFGNDDVKSGQREVVHIELLKDTKEVFQNPLAQEEIKPIKVESEVIKESKVQPPNPEEPREIPPKESKLQPKVPEEPVDKPETKETSVEEPNKESIIAATEKPHVNAKDEISQVEEAPKNEKVDDSRNVDVKDALPDVAKNDEAIDKLKKEALIEQIKQHDKEQRELVEEQKEILRQIKKTKMEIENEKLKEEKSDNSEKIEEAKPKLVVNPELKEVNKEHVHQEDEPKSYRLGEDLEHNKTRVSNSNKEAMVNNIPIPIALQRNDESKYIKVAEDTKDKELQKDSIEIDHNINKRSVDIEVQCDEQTTKTEVNTVKEIYNINKINIDKIDNILGPIDMANVVHQSRDLKSVKEWIEEER